ncbi:MAG: hypothetical protein ACK5PU_05685 [bacterium]|jgi:hypothetical protein
MPRDGDDNLAGNRISPALELAILRLWAAAMHMERSFSNQEIEALPELSRAIAAAHLLPAAIGWDDVLSEQLIDS